MTLKLNVLPVVQDFFSSVLNQLFHMGFSRVARYKIKKVAMFRDSALPRLSYHAKNCSQESTTSTCQLIKSQVQIPKLFISYHFTDSS